MHPDPRSHKKSHLWLGWDDPAPREREAQHNIIAAVSWAVSVACLIGIYMEILG